MLIKSIEMVNFRQFINEKINFSIESEKNVTVIHGENGTGKTTLLKAFDWVFYGNHNLFGDGKEKLLNKSIVRNMMNRETIDMKVEVCFIHKNIEQRLCRIQTYERVNNKVVPKESNLKIESKDKNGRWESITTATPQNHIDRIFPKSLSSYFLFDGERIRNLGDNNREGKKDIKEAISTVLNLDVLNNSVKHLKGVIKEYEKEYSPEFYNKENNDMISDINAKESELSIIIETIRTKENNDDLYKDELKKLSDQLISFEEVKKYELEKVGLEGDLNSHQISKENLISQYKKLFNNNSVGILGESLFAATRKYLENFELQDGVIEGISGKAIDQILEKKECLCGESIESGCRIHNALTELKKFLPPENYGVMVNGLLKNISSLHGKKEEYSLEADRIYNELLALQIEIDKTSNRINEISDYLETNDSETIKNIEKKRKNIVNNCTSLSIEIDQLKTKELVLKAEIKEQKNRLKEVELSNSADQLIQRKIEVVESLILYFEDFYDKQESEVKSHLQDLVGNIFNSIMTKDYKISFDEKYNFYVKDNNSEDITMSEGEKQITSLSFISGIVNMAKDSDLNKRFSSITDADSTEIYPVVMDSPFGSLDNKHRKNVATEIPKLSRQTILLRQVHNGKVKSQELY